MLINKKIIIKWNPRIKKIYESKGYIFTKWKDEFEVKIEDLTDGSHVNVDVKCDCCGKMIKNITWQSYKKYLNNEGKYYCQICSNKLYGRDAYRKTRLKNGKSFEQWCLKNDRQDILNRWDYELNDYTPNEISYATKIKYWLKCPKGIHKSELKNINSFTNGQEGSIKCKTCNSFAQWGIDNICSDFLEKYWDYDKNIDISPWKINCCTSHKKVWIKCQEKDYHQSYFIKCSDFLNNRRCPYCTNRKVHPLDSLGALHPQVLEIWSDKNKKSPYEYASSSHQKIYWKCPENKHEDYCRSINSSNPLNFNCPECSKERDESFLQEKVRLYLNELDYTILHEYDCSLKCINPKTKMILPYDNEIKELKLIIEIMGIQHEKISTWLKKLAKKKNTTPKQEFYMQKVRDRYKRMYAKFKGYFYLNIWYYHDDKKESWKTLINNKIKEIKSERKLNI